MNTVLQETRNGTKLPSANNRWLSVVAAAGFMMLAVALIVAHQSPATGYELDIYKSTPLLTGVFIILAMVGGLSIITIQIVSKVYETSRIWMVGLLLLIFVRLTLIFVPYIRGYAGWAGDAMGYLGLTNDILFSGHFTDNDFYPVSQTLMAQVTYITGLSTWFVANIITALISFISIISAYLLAKALGLNRGKQILASMIAGAVLLIGFYNVIMSPNGWSILMIPLMFYFYLNKRIISYTLCLLIFAVLYPFFHPLSCLILIIALVIIEIVRWLLPILSKLSIDHKLSIVAAPFRMPLILLESLIFLTWILSKIRFNLNISLFWHAINAPPVFDTVLRLQESLAKLNIHGYDFMILIIKVYGFDIILIILSLIGILLISRQFRYRKITYEMQAILSLAFVFIACGLLFSAYLLGLPGMTMLGHGQMDARFLGFTMIFTSVLAALTLYSISTSLNNHKLACFCIICILAVSSILSVLSLFPSPYIFNPNLQITRMDICGTRWFVKYKDIKANCIEIRSRMIDMAMGFTSAEEVTSRFDLKAVLLSDHFGYPEYANLGEQYQTDKYLVITKIDRTVYSTVWSAVGRFNEADFINLRGDPTVNSVYSNGEMVIYYVRGSLKF